MKTWLDEYIKFSAETWDQFMEMTKKAAGCYLKLEDVWDKARMWNQMAFITEEITEPLGVRHSALGEDFEVFRRIYVTLYKKLDPHAYMTYEHLSNKAMHYFMLGGQSFGMMPPINFQLAPDLAEDFHNAKAPETEAWRDIFETHTQVYIDFPPGTYVWDKEFDVRAVFATADISSEQDLRMVWMKHDEPILGTFPKINVMVVLMQKGKVSLDNVFQFGFAEGEPWSFYGGLPDWNARYIHTQQGRDPVTEFEPIMTKVMDLVKLSILYHQTKETPPVFVPSTTIDKVMALRNPKKQKARLREFSLFKVERLSSPKDRFGRTNQEAIPRDGFALDHRVDVRGHFRMQPYGEGSRKDPSKRKYELIWIDAFQKGPKGAPLKPKPQALHVLTKESETP